MLCCFQVCLTLTVLEENAKTGAEADVQKEEETAKEDEGVSLRKCLTLSHVSLP